ncbi:LysR family transcriptional regulator ArgP [Asticcacaulis solisilvae]|uniref:LysR family transcriptional regulator ArgP n=1 Tax=Asticcacaulis solisilvae TaxID=1217274 RepID=UPI003FD6F8CC
MIDYQAARAVAMVVQTGSFDKAAKALHVTPSAISQRIKQLEDRLGAVLIVRGTPCTATEKGAWLCRHMDHVGMLEKDLMAQLPGLQEADAPAERVTLNIASNADSLATWFLKAVSAFGHQTGYLFNIAVDDQDHTTEWLEKGRVLAAVTSVAKPVPGCHVTPLGAICYITAASPTFVERHFAQGFSAETLACAPALTFDQKDRLQHRWAHMAVGQDIAYPTHWLPSVHSFVEAALDGMGWGLHPEPLVAGHVATGRLAELVPGLRIDVPLFWQINRLAADRLSGLTRTVVATAKTVLHAPGSINAS